MSLTGSPIIDATDDLATRTKRPGRGVLSSVLATLRLLQVRLRIPLILVIAAIVVGRWDAIRNRWDRWTRGVSSEAPQAVSSGTEYFCPMDPGVVSDWPARCGICNMTLVRRKKGEAVALPDGVVSRMQLSPYRVQLAGIRTSPATFQPLRRVHETAASVEVAAPKLFATIELPAGEAAWIKPGDRVEVSCPDLPGQAPFVGRFEVAKFDRTADTGQLRGTVAIEDPGGALRPGLMVRLKFSTAIAELDPFRAIPDDPPPLSKDEPRTVFACQEHPDRLELKEGRCPTDGRPLEPIALSGLQRVRYWCPMHPKVTADRPGATCKECGGMVLRPLLITYRPRGEVLAVPESAVVDTGARTVVFVERMPGMFDGVEVVLGPRCGDQFPVVRGLDPGLPVAVAGAFLLDAETRLNPSLAASYFGSARGTSTAATATAAPAKKEDPLAGLSAEDRRLAEIQKTCPVTRKPLGSMGLPARVVVSGRTVLICCDGCEDALKANPARYLRDLPAAPASPNSSRAPSP